MLHAFRLHKLARMLRHLFRQEREMKIFRNFTQNPTGLGIHQNPPAVHRGGLLPLIIIGAGIPMVNRLYRQGGLSHQLQLFSYQDFPMKQQGYLRQQESRIRGLIVGGV